MDENDNNPVFESSAFEYKVLEAVEPGTTIAVIQAKDADSGEYGKITYLLDRMSSQVRRPHKSLLFIAGFLKLWGVAKGIAHSKC